MKKEKITIVSIIIAATLIASLFMTSCTRENEEDIDPPQESNLLMTIDLPSDSDNGNAWEFSQDKDIFVVEEYFAEDQGAENVKELHVFTLFPKTAGNTTVTFTNKTTKTTYTYECKVADSMDDIIIESSKGESDGNQVDAPELTVELN